jgi:predicted lipase
MKEKVRHFLGMSEDARFDEVKLKIKYPHSVFLEDKETDTQGFILPAFDEVTIAFRGTQQPQDWMTDINGFHEEVPYGNYGSAIRVHRGFLTAYKSVRDEIHEFINNSPTYINNIHVCGHSLGGALATLCAVDMQFNYPNKKVTCYPSGNPKVGNKAFVESYNRRVPNTIRTYMRTDVVPELPPVWIEKIFKQKSYHTKKKNPIGPRNIFVGFINWIKRRFKTKRLAADTTNHSMALYKKYA